MNELIVPVSILAVIVVCAVFAGWVSNHLGKVAASKCMEAERSRPRRRMSVSRD